LRKRSKSRKREHQNY